MPICQVLEQVKILDKKVDRRKRDKVKIKTMTRANFVKNRTQLPLVIGFTLAHGHTRLVM